MTDHCDQRSFKVHSDENYDRTIMLFGPQYVPDPCSISIVFIHVHSDISNQV